MDDALKSAALAAADAQRIEIQRATLAFRMSLLQAAFLAGVEWMRQQQEDNSDGTV